MASPSDKDSPEAVKKSCTSQVIEEVLDAETDQALAPLLDHCLWHSLQSLEDLFDCSFNLIAFSCDSLSFLLGTLSRQFSSC